MRFDNSRLEPIGTKTVKHGLPDDDFSKIWIHEQDDFTNYIGLDTSNNLRLINESVGSSIIIKVYSSTVQVQFLKRFMIVIPSSGNEIDKYIYKDGSYVELNITQEPAFKLSTTDDYYETDFMYVETAEGLRGKFFEKMNSLSDDNYFASGMMFRAAYKLFDGSYVLHTIPYFLGVENYLFTLVRSSGAYTIKFYAAKGKITFTTGDYSGMDDLKDVIQSVSLFATKMETFLEISEDTITDDNLEEWLEGNNVDLPFSVDYDTEFISYVALCAQRRNKLTEEDIVHICIDASKRQPSHWREEIGAAQDQWRIYDPPQPD